LIQKISPKSNIISIDYETRGTVETILEARKLIDNDEELLISDTDHYLLWNPDNFNKKIRTQNIDACVMVFPEPMSTTTASYLKLNEDNYVIEAAEKNPISTIASVGVHYFKKGSDFVKYSNQMIESNISYKNEFYVTPVYNFMVKDNKKIITSPIKKMWPLGSDKEIQKFIQEFPNSKSIQNNNGEENYE
jgi:dTDP-glucose pyrophosphorylase|tara:strand:- start:143 stop:715 length:573 start_codon:yes stop_codon:yes gene_type:complete